MIIKKMFLILIVLFVTLIPVSLASSNVIYDQHSFLDEETGYKVYIEKTIDKSNTYSYNISVDVKGKKVEFSEIPYVVNRRKETIHADSVQVSPTDLKVQFNNLQDTNKLKIPSIVVISDINELEIKPKHVINTDNIIYYNGESWISVNEFKIDNSTEQKLLYADFSSINSTESTYPAGIYAKIGDEKINGGVLTIFNSIGEVDRGVLVFELPQNYNSDLTDIKFFVNSIAEKVNVDWEIEM